MDQKACAIVLRTTAVGAQVLLFRHPLAGVQLVKGGIQAGETPVRAAVRELFEESGLVAKDARFLTTVDFVDLKQRWHICLCMIGDAPDAWIHKTEDDGGQQFSFFWQPVDKPLPKDTGTPYCKVINRLNKAQLLNF